MMRISLYFLLWFGSLGLAIFSSQNIYPVTIKFLSLESIKLPLGLLLIFCGGLGAILATFIMTFSQASIQFRFPNITKFANSSARKTFSKDQATSKQSSPKSIPKNESTQRKQKIKDDFDADWDDDWD